MGEKSGLRAKWEKDRPLSSDCPKSRCLINSHELSFHTDNEQMNGQNRVNDPGRPREERGGQCRIGRWSIGTVLLPGSSERRLLRFGSYSSTRSLACLFIRLPYL